MTQPAGDPNQGAVRPMALPANYNISLVQGADGKRLVGMQIRTPQGNSIFFLEPHFAKEVAALLERCATQASTGLILPNGRGL